MSTPFDPFLPQVREIQRLIDTRQFKPAENALLLGIVVYPQSPSVIWLLCKLYAQSDQSEQAEHWLELFLTLVPCHAAALSFLGRAKERLGKTKEAEKLLQSSFQAADAYEDFFALSVEADRQGASELALSSILQAIEKQPSNPLGLLQQARVLQSIGKSEQAASIYRRLIERKKHSASAWFALMDLKTVTLSPLELMQLRAELERSHSAEDTMLLSFALAKAYEDSANFSGAFQLFKRANLMASKSNPWNLDAFTRHINAIQTVFSTVNFDSVMSSAANAGAELIFLVGLPRSGTTLVEQVLSAHPDVEGASELPHLPQLIQEESIRRGKQYPDWAPDMEIQDWRRLASQYLQRTAKWREKRPKSTDKLPENWLYVGAIMCMFPASKVIDCIRDPTETTWSCYKQLFAPGRVAFSYRFEDLGVFWQAYQETMSFWRTCDTKADSAIVYSQSYEHLVTDTETEVRALLAFCQLSFVPQCLQAHSAQRAIRTPSAAQVRQPMTSVSIKAKGYGVLLDGLRKQFVPL